MHSDWSIDRKIKARDNLLQAIQVGIGDNIKISDSEKMFGTAYKNSINDTVIYIQKHKGAHVWYQISQKSNMYYQYS